MYSFFKKLIYSFPCNIKIHISIYNSCEIRYSFQKQLYGEKSETFGLYPEPCLPSLRTSVFKKLTGHLFLVHQGNFHMLLF